MTRCIKSVVQYHNQCTNFQSITERLEYQSVQLACALGTNTSYQCDECCSARARARDGRGLWAPSYTAASSPINVRSATDQTAADRRYYNGTRRCSRKSSKNAAWHQSVRRVSSAEKNLQRCCVNCGVSVPLPRNLGTEDATKRI